MSSEHLMDEIQAELTPHLREATKIIEKHWAEITKDSEGANAIFGWIFTFFMCPGVPEYRIPLQIVKIGFQLDKVRAKGKPLCPDRAKGVS